MKKVKVAIMAVVCLAFATSTVSGKSVWGVNSIISALNNALQTTGVCWGINTSGKIGSTTDLVLTHNEKCNKRKRDSITNCDILDGGFGFWNHLKSFLFSSLKTKVKGRNTNLPQYKPQYKEGCSVETFNDLLNLKDDWHLFHLYDYVYDENGNVKEIHTIYIKINKSLWKEILRLKVADNGEALKVKLKLKLAGQVKYKFDGVQTPQFRHLFIIEDYTNLTGKAFELEGNGMLTAAHLNNNTTGVFHYDMLPGSYQKAGGCRVKPLVESRGIKNSLLNKYQMSRIIELVYKDENGADKIIFLLIPKEFNDVFFGLRSMQRLADAPPVVMAPKVAPLHNLDYTLLKINVTEASTEKLPNGLVVNMLVVDNVEKH